MTKRSDEELVDTAMELWKILCDKKYTLKEALIVLTTLEAMVNSEFDIKLNS